MRYFPQRARRKRTDIGSKLHICTYCLGDMFDDGRCVQCKGRTQAPLIASAPLPLPSLLQQPIVLRERFLS